MPLDHRQLECFVAVAQERHIGRAATRLHMTQPPLTRRIQRLEREIGAQLFVRTPSGVEITAPGEALLEQALRILALDERALEVTRAAEAGESGQLIVGYFGSTIFDGVPRLLAGFRAEYPDVRLRLERIVKNDQVEALRDGRIHIGFGRAYDPEADMEIRAVAWEPLFVAFAPRFIVPDLPMVSDLESLPQILFPRARPSFADQVVQMCSSAGFAPRIANEAEDAVGALAYVATGTGVAVVPRSATNVAMPGVEFRALRDAPDLALSCMYRRGHQTPILATLLERIVDHEPGAGA